MKNSNYIIFLLVLSVIFQSCDNTRIERTYYDNGNIESEYQALNGIENGYYKKWHKNGNISISCTYKNGAKHGYYEQYYESGKVDFIAYLINDEMFGWAKKYDETGLLIHEDNFIIMDTVSGYFQRIDTTFLQGKISYGNQVIRYKKDGEIDIPNSSFFTVNDVKGNSNLIYNIGDTVTITIKLMTPRFNNSKLDVYIYGDNDDWLHSAEETKHSTTFRIVIKDELYHIEGVLLESNLDDDTQRQFYFLYQPILGKRGNSPK